MRFAAIESSTEWCSVALWSDGEIVALERRAGNSHGEFMLPMLAQLFARTGSEMRDLDAVAFGAGPGSFTGLRIACGITQGLAFARGLPVLGVSTLAAVAEESGAARVLVALDARMHEVYYAAYEKRAGAWLEVLPASCVAPDAVEIPKGAKGAPAAAERAPPAVAGAPPAVEGAPPAVEGAPPGAGWLGCGNGFAVYRERLEARLGGVLMRSAPEVRPSAVAVARLAAPLLAAGGGADAAHAVPVYLRDKVALTSAERTRGT